MPRLGSDVSMSNKPASFLRRSSSLPDIFTQDGHGHTSRTAAAAHEFRTLEQNRRLLTIRDLRFAREKLQPVHDAVAGFALELAVRVFIARIAEYDTRPHRYEVAAARPLLALLQCAPV